MTQRDVAERKAALRKGALSARKTAFAEAQAGDAVARATGHLLSHIGAAEGRSIAGYMPIRTEIDPRPAMHALHGSGARIGVPVIAGPGAPLDFREWSPEVALVEGPFGALVPETGDWLTPQVLIVPLVGFDAGLNRLGYGGGFYDRTIARLSAADPDLFSVGFAFAAQEVPAIPVEPTDRRLDAVITENGPRRA